MWWLPNGWGPVASNALIEQERNDVRRRPVHCTKRRHRLQRRRQVLAATRQLEARLNSYYFARINIAAELLPALVAAGWFLRSRAIMWFSEKSVFPVWREFASWHVSVHGPALRCPRVQGVVFWH